MRKHVGGDLFFPYIAWRESVGVGTSVTAKNAGDAICEFLFCLVHGEPK